MTTSPPSYEQVRDAILALDNSASARQVADALNVKYIRAVDRLVVLHQAGWITKRRGIRDGHSVILCSVRDHARTKHW